MHLHFAQKIRPSWRRIDQGLTLIETLIVIVVIGILAAIAAPSFLGWLRNKEVDDALALVVGALKEAQSEALRLGKGCTVNLDPANPVITANVTNPPHDNCLPTGRRDLTEVSDNMRMISSFNSGELVFTFKKTTPREGIIVLFQPESTRPRCVVISEGLGLIRTGFYQGDTSASSPSIAECQRNR